MDQVHPVSLTGLRAEPGGLGLGSALVLTRQGFLQGCCERGPLLRDAGSKKEADFCEEEARTSLTPVPNSIIYFGAAPPGWQDPWALGLWILVPHLENHHL